MLILLISAIVLVPLLLSLGCMYLHCPHNTVKIPAHLLLPFSVVLTLLVHLPVGLILFYTLPDYCFNLNSVPDMAFEYFRTGLGFIFLVLSIVYYCAMPAIISFYLFRYLRNAWELNKKLRRRYPFRSNLPYRKSANFLEKFVLHPISILAAYDPHREEMMVDIRTDDGFLYSGKLSNYFCDGRTLSGISLTHILKFDLRAPEKNPTMYFVPNNGEMYFVAEKIQDLHFWSLKKNVNATIAIISKDSAARLAWLCCLQKGLPSLNIQITAFGPSRDRIDLRKEILLQLQKCGLQPKDVKITFQPLPK